MPVLRFLRRHALVLLALIALHGLVVWVFASGVLPLQYARPDAPFWFHHGGDEYGYLQQAQAIRTGLFSANKYPLGFPILLQPFLWLMPGATVETLVQPVALFWTFVGFPLGQVALFSLVIVWSRRRSLAIVAVALWTILPLLTYVGLGLLWNGQMAEIAAVHMLWAQMLSDGPTALLMLLSLLGLWFAAGRGWRWGDMLLLGELCGFMVMVRYTAAILPLGFVGLLLWQRRWRAVGWLLLGCVVGFMPQAICNTAFFGTPLTTGYTVLDGLPDSSLFSVQYLADGLSLVWGRIGILTVIMVLVAIVATGFALYRLAKRSRLAAASLALWFVGTVAAYSVYYYTWNGGLFRFLIPVYPAAAVIAAIALTPMLDTVRASNRQHGHRFRARRPVVPQKSVHPASPMGEWAHPTARNAGGSTPNSRGGGGAHPSARRPTRNEEDSSGNWSHPSATSQPTAHPSGRGATSHPGHR